MKTINNKVIRYTFEESKDFPEQYKTISLKRELLKNMEIHNYHEETKEIEENDELPF